MIVCLRPVVLLNLCGPFWRRDRLGRWLDRCLFGGCLCCLVAFDVLTLAYLFRYCKRYFQVSSKKLGMAPECLYNKAMRTPLGSLPVVLSVLVIGWAG